MHTLAGYKITSSAIESVKEEARNLPPVRDAIDYIRAAEDVINLTDPLLRSYLSQMLCEEVGAKMGKTLAPKGEPPLVLAAVVAREEGYVLKEGQDKQLGKFVAKYHEPEGKTQHGRYMVNTYRDTEPFRETVRAFFK